MPHGSLWTHHHDAGLELMGAASRNKKLAPRDVFANHSSMTNYHASPKSAHNLLTRLSLFCVRLLYSISLSCVCVYHSKPRVDALRTSLLDEHAA
eukprot:105688-Prymnesium_polylepis.1